MSLIRKGVQHYAESFKLFHRFKDFIKDILNDNQNKFQTMMDDYL